MAFPPTSLINSKIDSALFFHKKYKKFGTKMIAIMRRIMPEIHPSSFSAMAVSERAPSKTYPASSLPSDTPATHRGGSEWWEKDSKQER